MVKEFCIAFKKAYNEANTEKLTAKQALKEFNALVLLQEEKWIYLMNLSRYLSRCSTIVSCNDYLKYFKGLGHILDYAFTENEDGTINLLSNNGYVEKARYIHDMLENHYTDSRRLYRKKRYAECIDNVKDGLDKYNHYWEQINPEVVPVNMKCIDYNFKK